jgi:hypothetical protein
MIHYAYIQATSSRLFHRAARANTSSAPEDGIDGSWWSGYTNAQRNWTSLLVSIRILPVMSP